jgi:alcohol-forming fatty acyl-CoA reductase
MRFQDSQRRSRMLKDLTYWTCFLKKYILIFETFLRVAVNMNIIGVKKIIDLCKHLNNLVSFIHISTAFSNCDRLHISEEVYNSPVKPEKLIEACDWIEDDLLNYLTPKIIQLKPNTYTYTKAIAETLIIQECKNKIPCAIVRPSIVGASWREPFPGWIDNFTGPTALFPATGTGILRSMLGNHEAIADIIPVDIPVNLMVAAAWYTNTSKNDNSKILVYNCTSGQINKLTWGMLERYGRDSFLNNPFEKLFFVPNPHFTSNILVKYSRTFFEQLVPAYVLDFFLRLVKKKPLFVRLQQKCKKAVEILEYFTTKQWEFTNDNLFMLMKELNETDTQIFNFDISDINWKTYIEEYCLGTKKFLMKEDMSNINACRRNLKRYLIILILL